MLIYLSVMCTLILAGILFLALSALIILDMTIKIRATVEDLVVYNAKEVADYLYRHGFTSTDISKFNAKDFLKEMKARKNGN